MAITRPVTRTIISTTAFGIPVADAINAIPRPMVIAAKSGAVVQNGIGNNVWASVSGIGVTMTALANRQYLFMWQAIIAGVAGQWVNAGISLDGGQPSRFSSSGVISGNAPTYGHNVWGAIVASRDMGGAITPGAHTLQLQVTGVGAGVNVSSGAPSYVTVIDLGPE